MRSESMRVKAGRGKAAVVIWLVLAAVPPAIGILGCGNILIGTYHAAVEEVAPPKQNTAGYRLEEVRGKLAAEPEQIELRANGRFILRRAGETIWEGVWRTEAGRLYLRAQVVKGVAVLPKLQHDKSYALRAGAIIDENRYAAYGLQVVYRKTG